MVERVQKILSQWGVASRRQAEQMILAGRVRLNGTVVQLGQKANPQFDQIEVDGKLIQVAHRPQLVYFLLHKPLGVVSTCDDPQGRTTVLDLLPASLQADSGIHPVGRLDANSTGALLLTNDGELTFHLTHPRHSIAKTYQVWVEGHPTASALNQWRQGVLLDGKRTRPAEVQVLEQRQQPDRTLLEVVLREGRNRQIRRVAAQLGHPVVHLCRIAIGSIRLGQLPSGQYRPLQASELQFLREQIEPVRQPLSRS
ncbi:MAG: pseudouridine synthase [Elainellaceae cyanobacterium]